MEGDKKGMKRERERVFVWESEERQLGSRASHQCDKEWSEGRRLTTDCR